MGNLFKSIFKREYPSVDYEEILNDDRTLMSTQIMLECMSRGKIPKNVPNREEYIERAKAIVFDREYMDMRRHNNGGRYFEQEEKELQNYLKEQGVSSLKELEKKDKNKCYERPNQYKVEEPVKGKGDVTFHDANYRKGFTFSERRVTEEDLKLARQSKQKTNKAEEFSFDDFVNFLNNEEVPPSLETEGVRKVNYQSVFDDEDDDIEEIEDLRDIF